MTSATTTVRTPALDGLRGVAVLAVVVNHARPGWLPGGWLGVDVFFVLSGFLITTVLVERARDARQFWSRRLRRLVPALVLLLATLAVGAALAGDQLRFRSVRADGLASLAGVVNWRFIADGQAYFDRFAEPSLLRHLWSLSVEAQFYLVWPLLLALLLRFGRRPAALATLALAVVSALAFVLTHDIDRAYFGTDTHAFGLLLGSAFALVPLRVPAWLGWFGVAGMGFAFVAVESIDWIPLVALVTVIVVAGAPRIAPLSFAPLRSLGVISYGVYLWHWPVLQLFDEWHLVAQLGLTLGLAMASWTLVERPILAGRVSISFTPAAVLGGAAALVVFAAPVAAPQAAAEHAAAERSVANVAAVAPDATPVDGRVLVVGDSVAYTLFPGLHARTKRLRRSSS